MDTCAFACDSGYELSPQGATTGTLICGATGWNLTACQPKGLFVCLVGWLVGWLVFVVCSIILKTVLFCFVFVLFLCLFVCTILLAFSSGILMLLVSLFLCFFRSFFFRSFFLSFFRSFVRSFVRCLHSSLCMALFLEVSALCCVSLCFSRFLIFPFWICFAVCVFSDQPTNAASISCNASALVPSGDSCTVTCETGYESLSSVITCSLGSWNGTLNNCTAQGLYEHEKEFMIFVSCLTFVCVSARLRRALSHSLSVSLTHSLSLSLSLSHTHTHILSLFVCPCLHESFLSFLLGLDWIGLDFVWQDVIVPPFLFLLMRAGTPIPSALLLLRILQQPLPLARLVTLLVILVMDLSVEFRM